METKAFFLSALQQANVAPGTRRERERYEELTCKGFHFPAFQGGRRKRINNESKKISQRTFWKSHCSQETLFESAS